MRYDDYAVAPDPYSRLADLNTQALNQELDASQRASLQGQQQQEISKLLNSALSTISVSEPQSALVKSVDTNNIREIESDTKIVDFTKRAPAEAAVDHLDAVHRLNELANHVDSVTHYVSGLGDNPPSTQAPWRQ